MIFETPKTDEQTPTASGESVLEFYLHPRDDQGQSKRNVREVVRHGNTPLPPRPDAPLLLFEVKTDDLGLRPSSTGGKKVFWSAGY